MVEPSVLHRRDTRSTWVWLALALCVLATLLVMFAGPSTTEGGIGQPRPTLRPQSNTRPMPPPSVARSRGLAA